MADKIVPAMNALTPKRTLVNTFTEWYRSYYPGEKIPKLADMTAVVAKKYKVNADGHWIGFNIRMDMIISAGTSEASTDDELPEIEFQEDA